MVKRTMLAIAYFHLHLASRRLVELYLHSSHASSDATQLNTKTYLSYIIYTVKKWNLSNTGINKSTYIYTYNKYMNRLEVDK